MAALDRNRWTIEPHLPFEFIKVFHEPDWRFPNGIPNPLLPENRGTDDRGGERHGADLGIAWDGDFDRCFFFDDRGGFIEGYYVVGLLAESLLKVSPGSRIVHDPRLTWTRLTSWPLRVVRRYRASPGIRSSRKRCARSMPSTAAR